LGVLGGGFAFVHDVSAVEVGEQVLGWRHSMVFGVGQLLDREIVGS
jgi:hypothetical protein